ncbi:MAG: hypothetical protein WCC90_03270 [Methylocella sp.]
MVIISTEGFAETANIYAASARNWQFDLHSLLCPPKCDEEGHYKERASVMFIGEVPLATQIKPCQKADTA